MVEQEPEAPPNLAATLHLPLISPVGVPFPFSNTDPKPTVLAQGAEGVLFKTQFLTPDRPCVLKYRPVKTWRHPTLDARLTRHRILSEARMLVKCRREGINVPGVLALDWGGSTLQSQEGEKTGGWMMTEWVDGPTIRKALDGVLGYTNPTGGNGEPGPPPARSEQLVQLMVKIGIEVGKMHSVGVIHGDLTTSNIMLRPSPTDGQVDGNSTHAQAEPMLKGDVFLIDFGLASVAAQDEDRAVDLYVLERAFGSTHPNTEDLFAEVLRAYGQSYKTAKVTLKRLGDVRMRGRKRSMLG